MTKKLHLLTLLLCMQTTMWAQTDALPLQYSFIIGGGVSFPHVKAYDYDFYAKNGSHAGYDLLAEARYFFKDTEFFGIGLQYDYTNGNRKGDKLNVHFIRPEIILRGTWANDKQGFFFSFGPGYLNYSEKVAYTDDFHPANNSNNNVLATDNGHKFDKGYFAMGFAAGYEFSFGPGVGAMLRLDFITADWFFNKDARIMDLDNNPYDDGQHRWFKNNINFWNLSLALQFGN